MSHKIISHAPQLVRCMAINGLRHDRIDTEGEVMNHPDH